MPKASSPTSEPSGPALSREDSSSTSEIVDNRNVDFAGSKRFWSSVMVLIWLCRNFIGMMPIDQRFGWMWLHLFHCAVR